MRSIALGIRFDDDSRETAEVYVDGIVNNSPRRFLLDTGCARTALKHDEFSSGFPSVGKEQSGGVFGSAKYDLIEIDSLAVGPLRCASRSISRARPGELDRDLLGMDVLRDHRLHFAFDESRVDMLDTAPDVHLPLLNTTSTIPCIEVHIGGTCVGAVWDTGASITLVDTAFVESHPSVFDLVGEDTGTDSAGAQQRTPTYMMRSLVIANCPFPPHRVAALSLSRVQSSSDAPIAFILGYSTLRHARWAFDFVGSHWGIDAMCR